MIIKDNNNERTILDFEARKKFYEKELETGDIIEYNGAFYKKGSLDNSLEVCLPLNSEVASKEALEKIRKTVFPKNAVTVVGYPKSGSHLMMSILDAIGIRRLETLGLKDTLVNSLDHQLAAIRQYEGLVHTNHCHLYPSNFPLGHKGKIVFVERATPAVVVSAYHYLKKLPSMRPYLKKHGISEDLQKFARFMFEGKHYWGSSEEYNKQWREFAEDHPELQIEFFKFGEVMADKPKEISRLLKFLDIENADLTEIVANSDIKKAREHRKSISKEQGIKFEEDVIFRSGKSNGWRKELSEDTISFYQSLQK